MALVLQHARPDQARAMLVRSSLWHMWVLSWLSPRWLFGMLQLRLAAGLLPGVVAGVCVASLFAELFNPARLRVAILSISAASAVFLLLR